MEFKIQNKMVGNENTIFLIAEAGVNHNGDIKIAHKLIDRASNAGADAIKFQTFTANEGISDNSPLAGHHIKNVGKSISHYDLIKKLELPFNSFINLKKHCEDNGLIFISTPYDIKSAEFLIQINSDIIKVASSELMNYPMLQVLGDSKTPLILSTGMSRWDEIKDAISFVGRFHSKICILKCTSNYPCSYESINLKGIKKLQEKFPDYIIGFSDHSIGLEASLGSIGFGARIIERHFTLDKNAWGPDHKASMDPKEFKVFVDKIRKLEKAFGKEKWDIQDEELSQRSAMQKGSYARHDIKKGDVVNVNDFKFLRPKGEITPKIFYLEFNNKKLIKDINKGEVLTRLHFKGD